MSDIISASEEVGFDDNTVNSFQFEKYKGKKGQTDRLAVVYCKDGKPVVRKAWTHFVEGVGYVIANDYSRSRFGEPQLRFATVVGQYATDKFGKIQQPFNESSVTVKFFIFGVKKYDLLRKANEEFPLDKHDLLVSCQEDKFQQLGFQSCKEAAWKLKPDVQKAVTAQVEKLVSYLEGQLGQKLTAEQIKEKLGESEAEVASDSTPNNADDVIAQL